ncbi:MAG TPA: ABC transporter permease [Anaerolineales bacterium]|nr:ABC transporter permease [Anaerolineales bacterium]
MTTETVSVPALDLKGAESPGLALTPGQLAWRRFRKHRLALIGAAGITLLFLFVIIGSILVPEIAANSGDLYNRLTAPAAGHIFGTDSTGRDVFNRIIYGGQISLFIGILAVALEVSLGTVIGGVAAYFGGWIDAVLMRFTEAMLAIPSLFLLIVLAKFLGRDIPTFTVLGRTFSGSVGIVILVIGLTSWMYLARIVRANVLSLKELDYITAAKALGANSPRIFFNHLVPNTLGPIIVAATLGLANAILTEAYVSFLGLGVQPPTATWGNMMDQAQSFILRGVWWMWVFPSLFIVFTILCINLMGDGLRDAFDPRSTKNL